MRLLLVLLQHSSSYLFFVQRYELISFNFSHVILSIGKSTHLFDFYLVSKANIAMLEEEVLVEIPIELRYVLDYLRKYLY